MADISKNDIRLVEITEAVRPGRPPNTPCWRVIMAFYSQDIPMVQVTWHIDRATFDESSLIPVARNWFHSLCSELAEATADWKLPNVEFEAMKRPQPKRR